MTPNHEAEALRAAARLALVALGGAVAVTGPPTDVTGRARRGQAIASAVPALAAALRYSGSVLTVPELAALARARVRAGGRRRSAVESSRAFFRLAALAGDAPQLGGGREGQGPAGSPP